MKIPMRSWNLGSEKGKNPLVRLGKCFFLYNSSVFYSVFGGECWKLEALAPFYTPNKGREDLNVK